MSDKIQKNIIIGLLVVIAVILIGLFFKDQIQSYFRTKGIVSNANLLYIPLVTVTCGEILEQDEPSEECNKTMDAYKDKIKEWNDLIWKRSDIDCRDFTTKADATDFYNYVGGDLAKRYLYGKQQDRIPNGLPVPDRYTEYFRLSEIGACDNDPFSLDADKNCMPCETFSYMN